MRYAELKPEFPASMFPQPPLRSQATLQLSIGKDGVGRTVSNRETLSKSMDAQGVSEDERIFDIDVDDQDLVEAGKLASTFREDITINSSCSKCHRIQ